ncbi:MAG: hypothetical protein ACK5BR_01210 [Bacteroidota bacterium]|nr:hypothetical protein [Algoriphagus sp.]
MELVNTFTYLGLIVSFLLLFLGLIRPVLVLWFLDSCTRIKVLKLYGTSLVLFVILFFLIHWN